MTSSYPSPDDRPPPPAGGPGPYPYGQPGYPPQGYGQQPSYPPPAYGQPAYGPPGYPSSGYGQPAYGQPAYLPPPIAKPTGWFIVNWLFFWPTAIYSLVSHWNKIDPAAYAGDLAAASFHAAKVKKLGIIALCIFGGLMIFYLILFVTLLSTLPVVVTSVPNS